MKKPRVIIRTAGSHRIYVEHNGERTVYALKAKRELEIARSSKKNLEACFRSSQIRKFGSAKRPFSSSDLALVGPGERTYGRRRTVPHPKTDRARGCFMTAF